MSAPLAVLLAALLAGCGGAEPVQPTPAASVSDPSAADAPPPAPPQPKRTILLDPGHNGGNAQHTADINRPVPDGRGGTKPCNTTGTSTDDGFPEYKFTWDVALRVRQLLSTNGVEVFLTRQDDTGWGPCVDVRGEEAAKINADAVVSIHADGAAPAGHGFHVIYSKPALNATQGTPSIALATSLRNALTGQGFTQSTYAGKQGLIGRDDLAGLNLAKRPAALVECLNMRNPDEADFVDNSAAQQRYANAITLGILDWLAHNPPEELHALAAGIPNSTPSTKKHSSESSTRSSSKSSSKSSTPKSTTKTKAPSASSTSSAGADG